MNTTATNATTSFTTATDNNRQCWICFDESNYNLSNQDSSNDDDDDDWIRPCQCRGGLEWVHESCLLRWIDSSSNGSRGNGTRIDANRQALNNGEANDENDILLDNDQTVFALTSTNFQPFQVVARGPQSHSSSSSSNSNFYCPHCKARYRVVDNSKGNLLFSLTDSIRSFTLRIILPTVSVTCIVGSVYGALYWYGSSIYALSNDPGLWSDLADNVQQPGTTSRSAWKFLVYPSITVCMTMTSLSWPDNLFPIISTLSLLSFPLLLLGGTNEEDTLVINLSDLRHIVAIPFLYGLVYRPALDLFCRISYALLIRSSDRRQKKRIVRQQSTDLARNDEYQDLDFPVPSKTKSWPTTITLIFPWLAFGSTKLLLSRHSPLANYLASNFPSLFQKPLLRLALGGFACLFLSDLGSCLYLIQKTILRHGRRILNHE